jgi:hypothetical protein
VKQCAKRFAKISCVITQATVCHRSFPARLQNIGSVRMVISLLHTDRAGFRLDDALSCLRYGPYHMGTFISPDILCR